MFEGLLNDDSFDTIAETSRFNSKQVKSRYYVSKHTGVVAYRDPIIKKRKLNNAKHKESRIKRKVCSLTGFVLPPPGPKPTPVPPVPFPIPVLPVPTNGPVPVPPIPVPPVPIPIPSTAAPVVPVVPAVPTAAPILLMTPPALEPTPSTLSGGGGLPPFAPP